VDVPAELADGACDAADPDPDPDPDVVVVAAEETEGVAAASTPTDCGVTGAVLSAAFWYGDELLSDVTGMNCHPFCLMSGNAFMKASTVTL
jgi:hypothetical protein